MQPQNANLASLTRDFIAALRIIYHEGLSDAFAHLSARVADGKKMLFMPRKSPALVKASELFAVDFNKVVPQSTIHQAIYKIRDDVSSVIHFHSPAVILLSVIGQTVRPMPPWANHRLGRAGSNLRFSSIIALLCLFAVLLNVVSYWPRPERFAPRTQAPE